MKRFLSMALCVLMFITMFTATAGQVMAAGNATEILTVTNGEFKDNKITFTVSLKPGVTKVTGAIVEVHFDGEDLKVVEDETGGAYNGGMFVNGYKYEETGVYSIGFMDANGVSATDSEKAFMQVVLEATSEERAMETVTFKCVELVTDDGNADNDIKKGNAVQDIYSHTFHSLSMPRVTEVNSVGDGLRVVWTDTQGAENYKLYRKEAGASAWTLLNGNLTTNEYFDAAITKGTVYYYTVAAINTYGATAYDNAGLAGMNFGNIESINAVATETGAKITWSALNGAEKYEVYRKLAVSSNWQLVATVTACEYPDDSIASCVDYNYKVKAIKDIYSADMSCDVATVRYVAIPYAEISNTPDGIEIYFETVGAEKYIIEKKTANGAYSVLTEIVTDEDYSFIDEDVVIDTEYSYTIQAVAGDMSSSKKEIGSVTRLGTPGVTEIKNTDTGVSLSWGAVKGATKYEIVRKTGDETILDRFETTALSYTDKNVLSGVKYTYTVSALNASGSGASSEPPVSITYVKAPVVKSVAAIKNAIEVKWGAVSGAESYKVYRTTVGSTNWTLIGSTSELSYADTTCVEGVSYKYTVSAVAGGSESTYNTVGVEGMYFGNVTWITATSVTDGAEINWEVLSTADSYEVYRKTADDLDWTKLAKVNTTKYVDKEMASGVVYFYMVKAFKGNNVSDMICTPANAKIIAAPTSIAKNANNGIQITVNAVNGAEGYVIEKMVDGEFVEIARLTNTLTYVDTDVVAESEYTYRVYAISSDINSAYYQIASIMRLSCPKITEVYNNIVGICITWTPIDDAGAYQVLRKEVGGKKWTVVANNVTKNSYIDADVFSDETYTYTVNAIMKDGGMSGYAENGTTYKFLDTPDIEGIANVSGGVQLEWSTVDGATAYRVFRKTSNTGWVVLNDVETTSFIDKTASAGVEYTYTVKAVDGAYESGFDEDGLSIVCLAKPTTPKLLKVANTASGVKVTWGASTGASKYIVYRKTYNAKTKKWGGWTNLGNTTGTSFVDKKATSGTYYLYTVRANNAAGNSGYNTTGLKTYFLATPKVSATNSNSGVTVKWTKSAGATGYLVYRKTTAGWTKVATVKGANTLSFTDKKASAGVTYRYTVKAYYGSYFSAFNTSGFAVRRLTTPTLKKATSAKAGITFTWTQSKGATGYIVYRKTTGGWSKIATVKGASKVSYLDKTAKKGVTYKYTVKAYYGTSTSYYNTNGIACKDKY